MKKRLDIVQSSTEPSKGVLWMTDGTLSYWGNKGWTEVNKSHNEIPSSGKEGQFLKYGKNGLEWGSVDVPTKVSQLSNDMNFKSDVPETIISTDPNGNDTLGLLDIIQSYAYDLVKSGKTRGNYLTSDTPKLDPVGRITGNGFVTGDSLRGWYAMWEEGSSWINITIIPGRSVSGTDNHNIAMIIYTYEDKTVRIEIVPRVYTLPAASASAIGGVKKVTLAKLDTSADITAVVTAYNSLVDKLVSSGIASV